MSVDLTKITANKGTPVQVHFQNPSRAAEILRGFTQEIFLEVVRKDIQAGNKDDGIRVHMMIPADPKKTIYFTDKEYWDWRNNRLGPTESEYKYFESNAVAIAIKEKCVKCQPCIAQNCRKRRENFYPKTLAEVISKQTKT